MTCNRPMVVAIWLAAVLVLPASPAAAAQTGSTAAAAAQTGAAPDPESGAATPAPVLIEGEPVLWITAGAGPYTPQFRADRISQRIGEVVRDRSLRDPSVTVVEAGGASELRAGSHLLMAVTARDAAALGGARDTLAR